MKAIDLFAGAGGFTTGAELAGCNVVWAANHWPDAVHWHAANHPETQHICQDLHQADWTQVPEHDLLLASPCCQGHSKARGKAGTNLQHDASRSTAWAVVSALEYHRPELGIVENVQEFLQWQLYPAWAIAVQALGYNIAEHILDAANAGVPQNRVRMFLVLTKSRAPVKLTLPELPHVPASSFIAFDQGNWSAVNKPGRSQATLDRVKAGRARFGERFIMPYYGSGSGKTGRSIDRPIGTITTRARWAVVDGDRMRMLTIGESRAAMSFPDSYQLPSATAKAVHMIGNAVCPLQAKQVIVALKAAA